MKPDPCHDHVPASTALLCLIAGIVLGVAMCLPWMGDAPPAYVPSIHQELLP